MKFSERQVGYLQDISIYIQEVESLLKDLSEEQFLKDRKTQLALERCLEIIGEAAGYLDLETISQLPDLPIKEMKNMRNLLIHAYHKVDPRIVWKTAQVNLPQIKALLRSVPLDSEKGKP